MIDTPTIFTTCRNTIDDLSKGYALGADDYLKKPFELKELLLRINALLKRQYGIKNENIEIESSMFFNPNSQTVTKNGQIFHLNHKETELLKLFVSHKNMCNI